MTRLASQPVRWFTTKSNPSAMSTAVMSTS